MTVGVAIACALCAASAFAVSSVPGFDRYRIILNRMPFGPEPAETPPPGAAAAPAAPAADSFIKSMKLCALTKDDATGNIQAGLTDTKSTRNYFMTVGDVEDGIELVQADYDKEKVLLRKGAEQYWLDMNSATEVASAAGPAAPGMPAVRGPGFGPSGPVVAPPPTPRPVVSVRRRDLTTKVDVKISQEELQQKLQQYQMDLIRSRGEKGPPLPIPLTKEMDDQLVKEGVLPALAQ